MLLGGFASAWAAGRVRGPTERGGAIGVGQRLLAAVCGGALAIGFDFGWFLERGGLGSAPRLAGQFSSTTV